MVGWAMCLFVLRVCVLVCVPQQGARTMFRLVEERDTEGLFPPSFLSVPIYTNKIQQDKQNSNCMQSAATHIHTHKPTTSKQWNKTLPDLDKKCELWENLPHPHKCTDRQWIVRVRTHTHTHTHTHTKHYQKAQKYANKKVHTHTFPSF